MSEQRDRTIRRVARTRAGLVGGAVVASLSVGGALAVTGALDTSANATTTTTSGGTTSSDTTSSSSSSSDTSSSSQGLVGSGDSSSTSHATTAGS